MPRPLEFDRDAALDAALLLFWRVGYNAAGLQHLLEVMRISRSSFYASFGDKRSLFTEVLQLFRDRTAAIFFECRARSGAAAAIPEFFHHTILAVPARRARRGCMMVNTILELAEVDDELSRLARDHLGVVERLFEDCLREARATGEVPAILSPQEAARYLMVVNQGLRVASRERRSRREQAKMINNAMTLLGLPAAA